MKLLVFILLWVALPQKVKSDSTAVSSTANLFQTMNFQYWTLKPFIYQRNDTLAGMIVEYYQDLKTQAQVCSHEKGYRMVDFVKFTNLTTKNIVKTQLTDNEIVGYHFGPALEKWRTNIGKVDVEFVSESISLISKMQDFHFYAKFTNALYQMLPLMFLIFMAVCFVGILFWSLEVARKRKIKYISPTLFSSIWNSVVTLTTVGYGDIIPSFAITKLMYVPWIMLGMVLACTFTSYISLMVEGTSDHVLLGKKVGALKDSTEASIAVDMLQVGMVKEYDTLEDLYKGIRAREVEHGILNSDIVMYEQMTWNEGYSLNYQLVIIKTLPIESKIHVTKKVKEFVKEEESDFFKCLTRHVKSEVLRNVYNKYRRPIKITRVYYPNVIKEMVNQDIGSYQITFVVAFGLIFLGLLYDLVDYVYNRFIKRNVDFISRSMHDELTVGSVRVNGKEFGELKREILKLKLFMDGVADASKQRKTVSEF